MLIEHVGANAASQVTNQACSNNSTVWLIEILTQFAHFSIYRVGCGGEFVQSVRIHHESCPGDAFALERSKPETYFNHVTTNRDPLGFAGVGDKVAVKAGAELDAGGQFLCQAKSEVE